MKQILLAIKSSNGKLYRTNENILLNIYNTWIKKLNLPIDVISIRSGEYQHVDNQTLYVPYDDNDMYGKFCKGFGDYVNDHSEYDVIINTNACTLINIEFINNFINSSNWDDKCIYGHGFVTITGDFWFVPGTFIMCSYNTFVDVFNDRQSYDEAINHISNKAWHPKDKLNNDETSWYGVAEDAIWGFLAHKHKSIGIRLPSISTRFISDYLGQSYYDQDVEHLRISPIFDLHFNIPYDNRIITEPLVLKLVGNYMMEHGITPEEYQLIIDNMEINEL